MKLARTRLVITFLIVLGVVVAPDRARTQAPAAGTRLEVASGSKAIYRVREQLARLNFPNDAVGTTESVTGALEIRPDGSFAESSKLTVDLRTLKTDEDRRDAFVRDNTLETKRFPLAEFIPRRHKGLPVPLPSSGTANFQLVGDMILHGVTSETTWETAATFAADVVTAKATTRFNFAKFKITVPKVFGLLSVDDEIRLELEVRLRRAAAR
jgi:polyisoprenoid-binding protein YceI